MGESVRADQQTRSLGMSAYPLNGPLIGKPVQMVQVWRILLGVRRMLVKPLTTQDRVRQAGMFKKILYGNSVLRGLNYGKNGSF